MTGRRLVALALLGGMTGLGSETLYFRILDATVGSGPLTSHVVVATFILAMGLGSAYSARVRHFSLVEGALGGFHLALAFGLPQLQHINGSALSALAPIVGPSVAASLLGFMLAAPPAFMLGLSWPAVVERSGELPRPYLLYALGATASVAIIEGLIFPRLGLPGGLIGIAAAHFVAAWLFRLEAFAPAPIAIGRPIFALALVGIATGAIQGGWLFIAELDVGPFYFVHPVVVATMLLGLCLGSLGARQLRISFGAAVIGIIVGVGLSIGLWAAFSKAARPESSLGAIVELIVIILPSALPIGALVPAYFGQKAIARDEAGAANLSISAGNVLGLALAGVLLSPRVPVPFLLVAPLLLLPLVLRDRAPIGLALVGVSAAFLLATRLDESEIIARTGGMTTKQMTVVQLFRGPAELAAIYRAPTRCLYQNGYHPIDLDQRSESVIAAVGSAYSHRRDRALVIGAGSGRSAGSVARLFKAVDILDVSPLTPALLEALSGDNDRVLRAANVRLLTIDGILAPHVLEPGYDLIVLTVDPGFCARAAKLYTAEALSALGGMLSPEGVLIYWGDSELSDEANQILLNTGKSVFAHQKLFAALTRGNEPAGYFFFVQSRAPLVWAPGQLKDRFRYDDAVRALPGFGGYGEGATPGLLPPGFRPPTEAPPPDQPDADRMILRPFASTTEIHRIAHPAPALLFNGP